MSEATNAKKIEVENEMETCPFCGQLHIAGGRCDCTPSVIEYHRKEKIARAVLTLNGMCRDLPSEDFDLLAKACSLIGYEHADKVSLTVDGTVLTVKGCANYITVDRTDKQKKSETV
jgi:hypothetical protein